MKVDAIRAFELLAAAYEYRRGHQHWRLRARHAAINARELEEAFDTRLRRVADAYWKAQPERKRHGPFDVCEADRLGRLWTLQRTLKRHHFNWLVKQNFAWQKWPGSKLPTIIKFERRYIIWNGTHRAWICLLTGRKLKVRFCDFDKFVKDRKRANRKRKHS